jgi:flagellar hook protein FlgE
VPSIIDGLFAGRAGIQSHGTGISVLADNIANANTTGFKYSRADFADLVAGNLSGGSTLVPGSGSQVNSITPVLTQGTFEFTGRGLDAAIDGQGYLVVADTGGSGSRYYTRAGNLQIDTEGNLLNQNGYQVLGFPSSGAGGLQALNVNNRATGSVDTAGVSIGGNLDASSPILPADATSFSTLNDTAQFSTFLDVFDSLGGSHTVTVYFFHTAANTWQARGFVDADDVGGVAGAPSQLFNVTMSFDNAGQRTLIGAPDATATPAWDNGSAAGSIGFTFDPFSQFASSSSINNISQDGTGTGNVVGFQIEESGTVFAQLDNGQTAAIGIVALASFANPEGLRRVGGSLYSETTTAGEPVIGRPNTGNFGSIESGALELSNADIASDFIKLISLQRGFQGSSRIITNINDLLNEIVNLA